MKSYHSVESIVMFEEISKVCLCVLGALLVVLAMVNQIAKLLFHSSDHIDNEIEATKKRLRELNRDKRNRDS